MAVHHVSPQGGKLATLDPIWERIRTEADDIVRREPELATFIFSTVLIIAFGIMALVGILTAIDSIKHTITKQFATMGANTFTVESRGFTVQIGKNRYRALPEAHADGLADCMCEGKV